MKIEHKSFDFTELKLAGEVATGSFEGYAAVFGNRDRGGDVIVKGAFTNLDAFQRDGFVSLNHNWQSGALPIATVTSAEQDDHGLKVSGEFHSTPDAQAVRTVVKERLARGQSVGMSIGYKTEEAERQKGGRELKALSLVEYSILTVPQMNPLAEVTAMKSDAEAAVAEFKAGIFADFPPDTLDMAGLARLTDALMYRVWEPSLKGEFEADLEVKRARLAAGLDEFTTIALRFYDALLAGTATEKADAAAVALKSLWSDPEGDAKSIRLPVGLTLEQHSAAVLGAVTALETRAREVADLREQKGGTLGADRRAELKALSERLAALHAATEPRAPALEIERELMQFETFATRHGAFA